ncbi:putative PHD finger domain protein [Aspergillus homomorphus CBS 101889]|uniref:PHD-type domain-containing protein n=1 Tax=Aspergillus homomorphus (strain CBS 101889) TaxID=1450537 RepID=A0A395I6W3_ASPHC|nr:hypothetical protein BO97DRAFT_468796 [Aspergillus homomorphus CBS 101889]RAL14838.1 hypothetical protein BO97DRAFT_468796 [Aspergillus homomorphus CBS 101889]
MAPTLRSSSSRIHSRPTTPSDAPIMASTNTSVPESTRPSKQRRTGRNTRETTDPPQNAPEQQDNGGKDWAEPPARVPAPSYVDSPWSGHCDSRNPVLSTMRPLGARPSPADLRKVGLMPKPVAPIIPAKRRSGVESNEPAPQKPKPLIDISAFGTIPIPTSADINVEKLKVAVREALRLAIETDNRPVSRGLLRLWESSGSDPFLLSVLEGVCQGNPGSREKSAFQSVMRAAWDEIKAEEALAQAEEEKEEEEAEVDSMPTVPRARSASSVSSLSSLNTFEDADANGVSAQLSELAPGLKASHAKGKHTRSAGIHKGATDLTARHSMPPITVSSQLKHALEEDDTRSEELDRIDRVKRIKLQTPLPTIVPPESQVRPSHPTDIPTPVRSPTPPFVHPSAPTPPPAPSAAPATSAASVLLGPSTASSGENAESLPESRASSEAGDNRRLTPTMGDDSESEEERPDNDEVCHECNNIGNLLCCDGCTNSYHFSCLKPPLDPNNPPEGDWYCPKCAMRRSFRSLSSKFDQRFGKKEVRDFQLPARIRDHFTGVRVNKKDGQSYEAIVPMPKPKGRRGYRSGTYDDSHLFRTADALGAPIFCFACAGSAASGRPVMQCDVCPLGWHMDCLDPPMAAPPAQVPGSDLAYHNWICPNHAWHDYVYVIKDEEGYDVHRRIRRPKHPRMVDIDVLLSDDEVTQLEEQEEGSIRYRVSEHGLKHTFITQVKRPVNPTGCPPATHTDSADRENEEYKLLKANANKFLQQANADFAKIMSGARAAFPTQTPSVADEPASITISNSRTAAERQAAVNLVEFAQREHIGPPDVSDRMSLLIDQLRANAPEIRPSAETEVASLQALKALIDRRIQDLSAQSQQS